MVSLAEFDLLRDARTDIRREPWADRKNREAMNMYFGVKRAREEVQRLNVEIPRLLTFMLDEHNDYYLAISRHLLTDQTLAHELSLRWTFRDRINAKIASRLQQTASLRGFSGKLESGRRCGRVHQANLPIPLPSWAAHTRGEENDVGNEAEDAEPAAEDEMIVVDDLSEQELNDLLTYMDNLGIRDNAADEDM